MISFLYIYFYQMSLFFNNVNLSTSNLKSNQRSLSLLAIQRCLETFPYNSLVKTNSSVLNVIISNKKDSSIDIIVDKFKKTIQKDPLNYVNYYNLFTLYAKQGQYFLKDALQNLILTITSINLIKLINQENQQIQKILVSLISKNSQKSIHFHLIKSYIHIKRQQYILTIQDLDKCVIYQSSKQLKSQYLQLKNQILKVLGLFNEQNVLLNNNVQQKLENITQSLYCQIESQSLKNYESIKRQIQQNLVELKKLFKIQQLKKHSGLNDVLFVNMNPQQFKNNICLTKKYLISLQKQTFQKSNLYLKHQHNKLEQIKMPKSSQVNLSQSSQKLFNQSLENKFKSESNNNNHVATQRKQNVNMSLKIQKKEQSKESMSNSELNKSQLSHNISSILSPRTLQKSKKKQQSMYPLSKAGQKVQIKLVMAQLTNNKQLLGTMNPYCILKYNKQQKKSSVIKAGGLQPRWKESFIFQLSQQPTQITLEVFDKGKFKTDDFVGSTSALLDKNGFIKLNLFEGEKQAGIIFITVQNKH